MCPTRGIIFELKDLIKVTVRLFMPSRQPQAGSTLIWLFLWIAGTAAIAYLCATRHVPAVQQQIQANAETAVSGVVASDGTANVTTSVYGRTVTLEGSVANEGQKAELLSALNAANGVRHVNDDQLIVVDGTTAETTSNASSEQPPDNQNQTSPSELTSEPTSEPVPEEAEGMSAETPTAELTPPEPPSLEAPTAELITPPPSPEAPTAGFTPPQPPAPESPTSAEVLSPESPTSEALSIAGPSPESPTPEAPSPEAPSPVSPTSNDAGSVATSTPVDNEQPIEDELAELIISNELDLNNSSDTPLPETEDESVVLVDVLEEESSTFSMQIKDGTLTLTGDIASEDDSLAFIQSAMRTFDVNYLVNSMQVNEENAQASWLSAITEFIPSMEPVTDASITIFESQVTLSGTVPDEQTHDKITDQALSLLSELSLVDSIIVSSDDPAPTAATAAVEPEVVVNPGSEPAVTDTTLQDTTQNSAQAAEAQPSAEKNVTSAAELNTLREAFKALEAEKILFQTGSDVLTDESVQTVAAMSALLKKYTDINIEIDGHTDSEGSSENNLQLSQSRANAVRDLMIERGIARERLSAYGFGDGVPIADNGTAAGRKLNRRIEFNF